MNNSYIHWTESGSVPRPSQFAGGKVAERTSAIDGGISLNQPFAVLCWFLQQQCFCSIARPHAGGLKGSCLYGHLKMGWIRVCNKCQPRLSPSYITCIINGLEKPYKSRLQTPISSPFGYYTIHLLFIAVLHFIILCKLTHCDDMPKPTTTVSIPRSWEVFEWHWLHVSVGKWGSRVFVQLLKAYGLREQRCVVFADAGLQAHDWINPDQFPLITEKLSVCVFVELSNLYFLTCACMFKV